MKDVRTEDFQVLGAAFLIAAKKLLSNVNYLKVIRIYESEFNCICDIDLCGADGVKGMCYPLINLSTVNKEITLSMESEKVDWE